MHFIRRNSRCELEALWLPLHIPGMLHDPSERRTYDFFPEEPRWLAGLPVRCRQTLVRRRDERCAGVLSLWFPLISNF